VPQPKPPLQKAKYCRKPFFSPMGFESIEALFGWPGSNPKGGLIHAGNKWIHLLSLIPFGGLIPLGFNPFPLFGWQGSVVGRK
jgi:hypothetical protein